MLASAPAPTGSRNDWSIPPIASAAIVCELVRDAERRHATWRILQQEVLGDELFRLARLERGREEQRALQQRQEVRVGLRRDLVTHPEIGRASCRERGEVSVVAGAVK